MGAVSCVARLAAALLTGAAAPAAAQVGPSWISQSSEDGARVEFPRAPSHVGLQFNRFNEAWEAPAGFRWIILPRSDVRLGSASAGFLLFHMRSHGDSTGFYSDYVIPSVDGSVDHSLAHVRKWAPRLRAFGSLPWNPVRQVELYVPDRSGRRMITASLYQGRAMLTLSYDFERSVEDLSRYLTIALDARLPQWGYDQEVVASFLITSRLVFQLSEREQAKSGFSFYDGYRIEAGYDLSGLPIVFAVDAIKETMMTLILAHESCHHYLGHTDPAMLAELAARGVTTSDREVHADACAIGIVRKQMSETLTSPGLPAFLAYLLVEYALATDVSDAPATTHIAPLGRFNAMLEVLERELGVPRNAEAEQARHEWLEMLELIVRLQTKQTFELRGGGTPQSQYADAYTPEIAAKLRAELEREWDQQLEAFSLGTNDAKRDRAIATVALARARLLIWEAARGGNTRADLDRAKRLLDDAVSVLDRGASLDLRLEAQILLAETHREYIQLLFPADRPAALSHADAARTHAAAACALIACSEPKPRDAPERMRARRRIQMATWYLPGS